MLSTDGAQHCGWARAPLTVESFDNSSFDPSFSRLLPPPTVALSRPWQAHLKGGAHLEAAMRAMAATMESLKEERTSKGCWATLRRCVKMLLTCAATHST